MDLTGLIYDEEAADFVHEHALVPDPSRGRPLTPEEANEAKVNPKRLQPSQTWTSKHNRLPGLTCTAPQTVSRQQGRHNR